MFDFQAITDALIACDEGQVLDLVTNGLSQGVPAKDLLNQGLIVGMDVVGERMEKEEMFIPEVLMAAKAMSAAVGFLKPQLAEGDVGARGRVVIGTVKGDLHDIGKNLVAMMLESAGLEVTTSAWTSRRRNSSRRSRPQGANMLALSALLTTTMPMMKETIGA